MDLQKPTKGSLHQQVADIIRRQILPHHLPGQRLEAAASIAQKLAVSTGTVTRALFALAKEGLVEQRHGSGTYVRQNHPARYIAVLCGNNCLRPRLNPFAMRLTLELAADLTQHGWRTRTLFNPFPAEETTSPFPDPDFTDDLQRGAVAGIVAVECNGAGLARLARAAGVPLVGCGWGFEYSVLTDYTAMVQEGTRQLLEAGRRRLALVTWGVTDDDRHPVHDETDKVFTRLLEEYGATRRDRWICRSLPPNATGSGWQAFREIWTAYPEKPDGLLILDDVMFQDAAIAIRELGIRVPAQLQIVTHANTDTGLVYPFPVARLEVSPQTTAATAGELLRQLIAHQPVTAGVRLLPARYVPQETVTATVRSVVVHS